MLTASFNTNEIRRACLGAPVKIRMTVIRAVREACERGKQVAKKGRFKDRTGQTRSRIRTSDFRVSAHSVSGTFESPALHSNILENGRKGGYIIYPKASWGAKKSTLKPGQTRRARGKGPHEYIVGRGIALRWKEGGETYFARLVSPGPAPAFHFMSTATQAALSRLNWLLSDMLRKLSQWSLN